MELYDIIVVGGGIAGMTTAVYALRNNKKVLIIEKESFGGQISNSPKVENFPSIRSISGLELSDRVFEQIGELGVEFELDEVVSLKKDGVVFVAEGLYGEYRAKSVVIASGLKHKTLTLSGEEDLTEGGVSYCAVCDGPFYKDENTIVIGDGNTAMQYTLLLSLYCKKVTICTLFDRFFGDDGHVSAMKNKDNVEIVHNVSATGYVVENGKMKGVRFADRFSGEQKTIACDGVFIAIGQQPNNSAFSELADLDSNGYIVSDETCTTKTDGLYVAGDCRTKSVRQLTTAVSDGAIAGLNACNYLIKNADLWK